ncbi:polysaccharide biosynthesis C-terminal domain-containing protein [Clostridium chrysemydis]|uniref:oligosaccharide flippase family protein n=1 Tax=Clostridium chrysemydis TaxID=2665504 RepID=UPI00188400F7|nr:polysaccharide biosynthesis C-terminal domain-containing protein [Clostridium chrysemydis]
MFNKRNEYLISVATKIIFVGLSFINSILINRYLGPTLKGEYAYILNISNIVTIIIGFNIASSLPYFMKKYGQDVKQKIINIIYFQGIIYFLAGMVAIFWLNNKTPIYVIIISIILQFGNQIDFVSLVSNINNRNKIVLITSVVYTFMLSVSFFMTNHNIELLICILMIYNILKTILLVLSYKLIPRREGNKIISLRNVVKFSIFPMITALLTTFNYNIDIILLKSFVSDSEIGIYSVGVTLASMLWVIPDAFKEVLFSKTSKSDPIKQIVMSIKINVYISIIIILGFVCLGKGFVSLFYGESYVSSYGVSAILLVGTIPMIFFKIINTQYLAIGKQRFSFYVLASSVIMNVIMNYITIPLYGIKGAALSSVVSYLLCGIIMIFSFKNKYNLKLGDFIIIKREEIGNIKKMIK